MPQSHNIFFVTFPDGKVDEDSLNVVSKDHAKKKVIYRWMPDDLFGTSTWLDGYVLDSIWKGMEAKGFKINQVHVDQDGQVKLANKN